MQRCCWKMMPVSARTEPLSLPPSLKVPRTHTHVQCLFYLSPTCISPAPRSSCACALPRLSLLSCLALNFERTKNRDLHSQTHRQSHSRTRTQKTTETCIYIQPERESRSGGERELNISGGTVGVRGYTLVTLLAVLLVPAVPLTPLLCECVFFSEDLSRLYIQREGGREGGSIYITIHLYNHATMKKVPGCCCLMHLPCTPNSCYYACKGYIHKTLMIDA